MLAPCQIGAAQIGAEKAGRIQPGAGEIGFLQDGAGEIGIGQVAARQVQAGQVAEGESGARAAHAAGIEHLVAGDRGANLLLGQLGEAGMAGLGHGETTLGLSLFHRGSLGRKPANT